MSIVCLKSSLPLFFMREPYCSLLWGNIERYSEEKRKEEKRREKDSKKIKRNGRKGEKRRGGRGDRRRGDSIEKLSD